MAVPAAPGLIQICDLAGRARGTGFLADDRGTLLTSHEAVDGLSRLVLRTSEGATVLVESDGITPLPGCDLALVAAPELTGHPLVIATSRLPGTRVLVRTAEGWLDTVVGATVDVTYTATDRFHTLEGALELELPEQVGDALRLSPRVTGAPVLDAVTGAVVGVLGTALHSPGRACGYAVPLRPDPAALATPEYAPLAALLGRNALAAPGYGADLNLAGVLLLTGASVAAAAVPPPTARARRRPTIEKAFEDFLAAPACLLALVGEPGAGRSTELAGWAARRVSAAEPRPTLWLRGADLRAGDHGVQDAVHRVLADAGSLLGRRESDASGPVTIPPPAHPDVVARLAAEAGRPLLVLLDGPEEMPPHLAHELRRWCLGTANWLRVSGARLALACRPEFWDRAGRCLPEELLYGPNGADSSPPQPSWGLELRPHVPLDAFPGGHPLTDRILAQLRPVDTPPRPPDRREVYEAWVALVSLRIATSLGASRRPPVEGAALRRLAATASGRLHLAARRCLGPGQGGLSRAEFEAVFPWSGGWATAVLSIGVLQPAGEGYRFSDEALGDWLQGAHLEVDAALDALVHHPQRSEAVPVPRHRIGPVAEALLLCHHTMGPRGLGPRLRELIDAVDRDDDEGWWACRLLRQTLLRVPDARPYLPVLRVLATRLLHGGGHSAFGPSFWARLTLETSQLLDLLRQLLPLDDAPPAPGERYLDVVARLLAERPRAVTPLLCRWFSDGRELRAPGATVAGAAGALLYAHRRVATDELADSLVAALTTVGGGAARGLLEELVQDEPEGLGRAVHRWSRDEREDRRSAAARYLPVLAARTEADPVELAAAARQLLRAPDEAGRLHPAAYAVLVQDRTTRASYLSAAQLRFAREPFDQDLARALVGALHTHPRQVLAALRHRLCGPAPARPETARGLLTLLADVHTPALARPLSVIVGELARRRPESAAEPIARFVDRRLGAGAAARAGLRPLVGELLSLRATAPRTALARVLAAHREPGSLAEELAQEMLAVERDPAVRGALEGAGAVPALPAPSPRVVRPRDPTSGAPAHHVPVPRDPATRAPAPRDSATCDATARDPATRASAPLGPEAGGPEVRGTAHGGTAHGGTAHGDAGGSSSRPPLSVNAAGAQPYGSGAPAPGSAWGAPQPSEGRPPGGRPPAPDRPAAVAEECPIPPPHEDRTSPHEDRTLPYDRTRPQSAENGAAAAGRVREHLALDTS
ncbi:serine protease [Streptomyces sp. XM4193]|uniref:serine protease n=1 Tax=Streptomyces sp. XM4193 TaxID=2929782 RepID=UPI001FFAC2DA|nr:serine protease [Streptomyces sp. XM4193]MCK1798887.1 serine protease [Streptomyces sp. XM4193]